MGQKIYITVTNDLVTDQRVNRTATVLSSGGALVCLIGRKLPGSLATGERPYQTRRLRLLFTKGFLFYACFNFRLLLFLLTRRKTDLIVANDLDTLPACFLASRIRRTQIVYDSHEFFTEVPELQGRRFVRSVWLFLEKIIVPRLALASTVNDSIARIYSEKYGTPFQVIRNVPEIHQPDQPYDLPPQAEGKKIVIYQGAVNTGRGIEQVIRAVAPMDDVVFLVAGTGDIVGEITELIVRGNLSGKVILTGRIRPENLRTLTRAAHLGISCELNAGLNYYYALPNKLFSYLHAGIPVLTSAFPEMKKVVDTWKVGMTIEDPADTTELRRMIGLMLTDEKRRTEWKKNAAIAARELCWENEQIRLQNLYNKAGINFNQP